jgi:hypothetical protein
MANYFMVLGPSTKIVIRLLFFPLRRVAQIFLIALQVLSYTEVFESMSEASYPKSLSHFVTMDQATQDPAEEFLRAINFGLDQIEAMSPDQRAELAQRELSPESEQILQRFQDSRFLD